MNFEAVVGLVGVLGHVDLGIVGEVDGHVVLSGLHVDGFAVQVEVKAHGFIAFLNVDSGNVFKVELGAGVVERASQGSEVELSNFLLSGCRGGSKHI